MPKLFVEKAEEQFGPSLKSEVKPGEDVYKNEKYNFEIKYFTDQFAIEKDYETERLHQEPKLLFEAIFNDTKYGWNVGKTTSQPAMTIRVFECLESTLDGCVSEISCLQPFEYSPESYRKVITDPLTEFNTFPAKQLEVAEHSRLTSGATIFEGEDKREGMMIFKENHLYVILVLTSSEIFQPIPKDILNQMLSTFRFIEVEETANWKTFKNRDYGFEIKYPQNWLPHNLSPIEGVFRISFWDKDCSIECGSIEINIKNRNNKSFQQIKQETENKYSLVFLPQVFPFKETKVDKEQAFIIPGYEFILGVVTVVHEGYIYEISRTYSEEDVPEELFNQILSTFRFLE
ncbi:MAG: hypothetical protein QME57_05325 [Patescibacteria group bacterium]|nr:hypothetical protein [Patescibacteria group bacterium]